MFQSKKYQNESYQLGDLLAHGYIVNNFVQAAISLPNPQPMIIQ